MHADFSRRDHDVGEAAEFVGEDVDDVAGFMEEAAAAARSAAIAVGHDAGAVEQDYSIRVIVYVEELPCEGVLQIAADFGHRVLTPSSWKPSVPSTERFTLILRMLASVKLSSKRRMNGPTALLPRRSFATPSRSAESPSR